MNTKHFFYLTYLLIWVIHRRVSADYNTAPLLKTDMLKDGETGLSAMNGNIYSRVAQTFDNKYQIQIHITKNMSLKHF